MRYIRRSAFQSRFRQAYRQAFRNIDILSLLAASFVIIFLPSPFAPDQQGLRRSSPIGAVLYVLPTRRSCTDAWHLKKSREDNSYTEILCAVIYARLPKYYSPQTGDVCVVYVRVYDAYACSRSHVFTKAMNTGCGINSGDGLSAFEIGVVRGKKRIRYTYSVRRTIARRSENAYVEHSNFLTPCNRIVRSFLENNAFSRTSSFQHWWSNVRS